MARTLAHLLIVVALAGCEEPPAMTEQIDPADPIELGQLFVDSQPYRRSVLERAIVNPDNQYSALRLANYAAPNAVWDELAVLEPEDLGPPVEWTHDGLMKAGEHAFRNFPMRTDQRLEPLRGVSRETAGFWVDRTGRVGGLTEHDGQLAWTCSSCHARTDDLGELELGAPNAKIDVAALYHLAGRPNSVVDAWKPGTIDPTTDDKNNPSTIGDLRAVRYQSHLHWTATLRNSLAALAIRVETLYIVSSGEKTRPPRDLAFAVAYFLWNLTPQTVRAQTAPSAAFETNCATCHHADGTVGAPLPWAEPQPARGTGYHRVPSLVGVADRGLLLHDGSVASVDELLRDGPPWHRYGQSLDDAERRELVAWVAANFAL